MWPLLPFVLLPILEIALFIQVGGAIGVLPTIGLVILSAALGVTVLRQMGATAARDVQRAMQEFRDPTAPMAHGALTMLAGLLLILPGLFTSAVGLLLLIPAVRGLVLRRMGRRVGVSGVVYRQRGEADFMGEVPPGHPGRGWRDDGVIDAEYSVQDDPPAPVREGLTDGSDQPPSSGRGSGWTRH